MPQRLELANRVDVLSLGLGSLAISGFISFVFGEWSQGLSYLLWAVLLDYATGWAAAGKSGSLKSKKSYEGIKRKVVIFAVVSLGHMCDMVLGDLTKPFVEQINVALPLTSEGHVMRDAIIIFYLFNEWLSITENCLKLGLPIPTFVKKLLEAFKEKEE